MKAVLYQKSNKKVVEVIDNVNDYDKDDISGDARIQGLSPGIDWKLLDDSVEIPYKIIEGIKIYDDIDLNQFENKIDNFNKIASDECVFFCIFDYYARLMSTSKRLNICQLK